MTNPQFLNSNRKKKRAQRAVAGDKNGRGLRQFSMKGASQISSSLKFVCCFCPSLKIRLLPELKRDQWEAYS